MVGGLQHGLRGDLGLVDGGTGWAYRGRCGSTQEYCGVFTAGICTIVTRTALPSCNNSQRKDS